MNTKEIREQAKKIIDNFADALKGIKVDEEFVERPEDRREESETEETDPDFREALFKNAPDKDKDCIVAEKGEWES